MFNVVMKMTMTVTVMSDLYNISAFFINCTRKIDKQEGGTQQDSMDIC